MREAVLDVVEAHVLVSEAVDPFVQLPERDDAREQQAQVGRERKDVERRLKALVEALEEGGEVETLVGRFANSRRD